MMDERLARMRDWDGRPRFYPPGQHPATARLCAELERARAFRDQLPESLDARLCVERMERDLTMFEQVESETKMRFYERRSNHERHAVRLLEVDAVGNLGTIVESAVLPWPNDYPALWDGAAYWVGAV